MSGVITGRTAAVHQGSSLLRSVQSFRSLSRVLLRVTDHLVVIAWHSHCPDRDRGEDTEVGKTHNESDRRQND